MRNSGLRSEILFGNFSCPRASTETPGSSQATVVISYPVGRLPLSRQPFLMLGEIETNAARKGKINFGYPDRILHLEIFSISKILETERSIMRDRGRSAQGPCVGRGLIEAYLLGFASD